MAHTYTQSVYYWNLSSQTETLGNLHGCQNKNIANKLSKQWSSEKWTQISLEFLFLWCLYIKLHEIRAKRPQNFIWFSASFSSVHADNNINKHFYFATNKTESVFCLPSTSIKIVVFIIVFFCLSRSMCTQDLTSLDVTDKSERTNTAIGKKSHTVYDVCSRVDYTIHMELLYASYERWLCLYM